MKILFSPDYSGNVYVKACGDACVMMDTVVVNTIGLVALLELRLGLHYEAQPEHVRIANYYKAMCEYMTKNPQNVMAKSFKTAGLSTAKAMLAWRDELRLADWDFDGEEISERIAVLIGIEEYFRKQGGCDMAGRLHIVTDQICFQELNCEGLTIVMAVDKSLLKPTVNALIEMLESHGATVVPMPQVENRKNNLSKVRGLFMVNGTSQITLDKDDDSIQIWKFDDERLAYEYLAYNNIEDVDVWINADNKQMDNWLSLMGKAQTGSVATGCTPQLTQLFVMGLGMFSNPLNVNTLIEWLSMPIHPIDSYFRSILADTIVSEGGYRNDACKNKIEQYVDGKFVYLNDEQKALSEEEQLTIRQKGRENRQELVDTFLPPLSAPQEIKTDDVRRFVEELSSWARQRAHLMANEADNAQLTEQLMTVAGMCDAFKILLKTIQEETIDYKTIDSWVSSIYQKGNYTNAVAECGCRIVVDSPAKIASIAKKTVWIGVDGDASQKLECAFLYPTEKEKLKEFMQPWAEDLQNKYHEQMMLTPLRMTNDKLILVVREHVGGELAMKHPLMVRLEQQIKNIDVIISRPKIGAECRHEAKGNEQNSLVSELHFEHADKIKWPDHLSPTKIGTLVEYPFDYLMDSLLGIVNDSKVQMADVKTTKGNVAHAVIERLFVPRDGKRYSEPTEIEQRIQDEYERIYESVIDAKGAILQLTENKLGKKLLQDQLHKCLDNLIEILKANELKVTGCERYVECKIGLGLPQATDKDGNIKERDMLGYIDMTLEDKDGHPVVFDFKWTTWVKGYQEKLTENRSVQLEFYRMMLGREKKDKVERVAYFLMPQGRLYSQEKFEGNNCIQLQPTNQDNIVEQLRQSVIYRKKQIDSGVVEINGTYEDLWYVKNTEGLGLFPLKKEEDKAKAEYGKKESNRFSQYGLLNN